jgi:hypothetical protein
VMSTYILLRLVDAVIVDIERPGQRVLAAIADDLESGRPFMATGEYPIECEVWIVVAATLSKSHNSSLTIGLAIPGNPDAVSDDIALGVVRALVQGDLGVQLDLGLPCTDLVRWSSLSGDSTSTQIGDFDRAVGHSVAV